MIIVLNLSVIITIVKLVNCYGFYCHDLIASMVWDSADGRLKDWLCSEYKCCTVVDMKTLAALPDLLKHNRKFIQYFSLHFFNNDSDFPPLHCSIDYQEAMVAETPNLIQAINSLLRQLYLTGKLSFIELSYLIHFISDLHQPLHVTGYQKGGLERKLCSDDSNVCFSLHALWDAELHKRVDFPAPKKILSSPMNIEETLIYINKIICQLYVFDPSDDLEIYAAKFEPLANHLLQLAAQKVLWLLEEALEMDSLNTIQDFERELTQLIKSLNTSSSQVTNDLQDRICNLVRQFNSKSAFLSGYQLRSLKEKIGNLSGLLMNQKVSDDDISVVKRTVKLERATASSTFEIDEKRAIVGDLVNFENYVIECEGDLVIENVVDSTVTVQGIVTSAVIKGLNRSSIMVSSSGPVNINDCRDSKLDVTANQLRIHDSMDCRFQISCDAGCIVEDCRGLIFSPISSEQHETTWKSVEDFTSFDRSSFRFLS